MGLQSGNVVDRYRLEERLGAGAFGEVWRASHLANGEDVGVTCAIKLMRLAHDHTGSSPRIVAGGWLDEVRNLVRVAGDTIPRILEANVWNEHAYIAMELLVGGTLAARLEQGPVPWRRALFIADQIARALEAAHAIGIIHRDLKPHNVILAGARRACVVDWGIARLRTSTPGGASDVVRRPTTSVETTDVCRVAPIVTPHARPLAVGTPGYMAPELHEGAEPAPEQDVYALGVVLYEMIAGRLPYDVERRGDVGAHPGAVKAYRASLDKATMDYALVPLRDRCPDVPGEVLRLVDELLARDPGRRPRSLRAAIDFANRFPHAVPDPPYAGLSTLGPRHAGLYFGQQEAIQHVLARLRSQRGVLLWGPSGSGKSSLALAGVAGTMDRTLFLDTDGWDIHVIRPREAQGFRPVPDAAPPKRSTLGQVIVVDQLEEVVDLELRAREVFCAAVLALLDRSAPVLLRDVVIGVDDEVKVVATIRDDLEWRVDREVPALRPLFERRIIVTAVDANFARSIIEAPARAQGFDVEGIEEVSRDVEERLSSEPAKLPVVQYALSEWWERRDHTRRLLPLQAWRDLDGVDGALCFVAEQFYSALDHGRQARVKALFVQLFKGGRKQPLAESTLAPDDRRLLQQLMHLRLVGRRDKKGSAPFYEVEHEYLSENWKRLATWLAEARDDRALADELERDAAAYVRSHDPDRLWRRRRLASATEMVRLDRIVVNASAKQFLKHAKRRERRGRIIAIGIALAISLALAAVWGVASVASLEAQRIRAAAYESAELAKAAAAAANAEAARANVEATRANGEAASAKAKTASANAEVASANAEAATAHAKLESANARIVSTNEQLARLRAQVHAANEARNKAENEARDAVTLAADQAARAASAAAAATQAETKGTTAEQRASAAEQRAAKAELEATQARERAAAADKRASKAEHTASAARERASKSERKADEAGKAARRAEALALTCLRQ